MQLMKLGSFALVAALAAGSVGCVVRAHGRVHVPVAVVEVEEEPPPPRVYIRDTRPGFVFIQGRWDRRGGRWEWRDGYWERQRAGHAWEDGRWERRGRGHVWVEGRWRAGAGDRVERREQPNRNVRDHRRKDAPPPPRDNGPVIRDHRR
jgi:hypothetical protein